VGWEANRAGKPTECAESTRRMALCLCTAIQSMCNHPLQLSHPQCSEWSLQPANALAFRNSDDRVHVRPNWMYGFILKCDLVCLIFFVCFYQYCVSSLPSNLSIRLGNMQLKVQPRLDPALSLRLKMPPLGIYHPPPYTSTCLSLESQTELQFVPSEVKIASVSTPTRPWTLHMAHPL